MFGFVPMDCDTVVIVLILITIGNSDFVSILILMSPVGSTEEL